MAGTEGGKIRHKFPSWLADANLTWFTHSPDLTPCFRNTALVWVPCGWLWAAAAAETRLLCKSKAKCLPWTWMDVAKLLLTASLLVLYSVDLIRAFAEHESALAFYITPLTLILTMALICILTHAEKSRGIRESGIVLAFWLLFSLRSSVSLWSRLRSREVNRFDLFAESSLQPSDLEYFNLQPLQIRGSSASAIIEFAVAAIEIILHCFSEAPPVPSTSQDETQNPSPEKRAPFLSRIGFSWFTDFIRLGWRRPIAFDELWDLDPENASQEIVADFEKNMRGTGSRRQTEPKTPENPEKSLQKISILSPLWKTCGPAFLFNGCLLFLGDAIGFANPLLLHQMISFVNGEAPQWQGCVFAIGLLVAGVLQPLMYTISFQRSMIVGMRTRAAIIAAIYKKVIVVTSLRLSSASRKESSVGEMMNLMSVDAQRFLDVSGNFSMILTFPIQLGIAFYLLWAQLGPSLLAGVGVILLAMPINSAIAARSRKLQVKRMNEKDERMKLMSEVLNGIKVPIRDLPMCPRLHTLVGLASLATYVLVDPDHVLDASRAFVSLSLLRIIRAPLTYLPYLTSEIIQVMVSVRRINKFMNANELDSNNVSRNPNGTTGDCAASIENGTFAWAPDDPPVLMDVDLQIPSGKLVAVVGQVGSGKSSLLSAFLGDMEKVSGLVNVD
ncbi:unnamed protein product, partial [Darwinula stevensoni]